MRRAVNYVVDKAAFLRLRGGPVSGQITGHVLIDSLEQNLLLGYDPFSTPGGGGSVAEARAEMRLARYDRNHDGLCDASGCRGLLALALSVGSFPRLGASIHRDLARIGIEVSVMDLPPANYFAVAGDPTKHVAMTLTSGWGKDYPNGSQSVAVFSDSGIPQANNYSLIGASPAQLTKWGYRIRTVPSVDRRIQQCVQLIETDQVQCWAALDQYITDVVVPWVPVESEYTAQLTSTRVVSASFDQFTALPAFDRIALRPD